VKTLAWEGRTPVTMDQFYIHGKQCKREYTLINKVDTIITDAPSLLTVYYTQVFGDPSMAAIFRLMGLEYRRMMEKEGVKFLDVWLRRKHTYDPRGRFQNEEQAKAIDVELYAFLKSMKLPLLEIDGDEHAADKVIQALEGSDKVAFTTPQTEAAIDRVYILTYPTSQWADSVVQGHMESALAKFQDVTVTSDLTVFCQPADKEAIIKVINALQVASDTVVQVRI